MGKTIKNFRQKENERQHGKIAYRERLILDKEAKSMIEDFANKKCFNEQCYCTGACKESFLAAEDQIEFKEKEKLG